MGDRQGRLRGPGEVDRILGVAAEAGVEIEKVLMTHGHIDHVSGTAELARRLGVPIEGPHQDDRFWIDGLPMQSRYFGFPEVGAFVPGRWLEEGQRNGGNIVLAVQLSRPYPGARDLP